VSAPADVVEVMNDFFRVTVRVVEEEHRGMVNKYLGAAVRDRSGDSFSFEELPPQEVRGIEGRLPVFAVR